MRARIGFVIVSHDNPAQLLRLIRRLIMLYDNPIIVCHHDFSKCSLEEYDFPKEVSFVRPHIETKWGDLSVYRAFLAALCSMYERADSPDWFVLLSGTDYPVRPAQRVLNQLSCGGFDAYMDYQLVEHPWTPDPSVMYEPHAFHSASWVPLAYDRYVAIGLWVPGYSWKRRKPIKIPVGVIRSKLLVAPFNPFSRTLKCYAGPAWYTGNRRAAERLLAQSSENRALLLHYSKRFIPDESLSQTILCNQPDLKISKDSLRYIDWSLGGHHPKTLGMEDVPRILASGAHFARKFDLAKNPEVFDAIDAAVDAACPEQSRTLASTYRSAGAAADKEKSGMRISVVIPAYNAERFLRRCLASVFAQTLKPDEVIVVDDGSTDRTAALAAELGATVVRRPNGGLSAARNTGIQNASGEWIALLDADDLWAPTKLERQTASIESDTVLVYTGIRFFDDRGSRGEKPATDPAMAREMLRYCNPIPCTYIVRREALLEGGGYREDIRACEDWEMLVRLLRLGKFVAVADPLTEIYLHPDSLSANPDRMLRALEQIIDTTLLEGLRGLDRWAWRRRVWAEQLSSAGLIARDNKLKGEVMFMIRSICVWPSPLWAPRRFAMLAVSARNRFRTWRS